MRAVGNRLIRKLALGVATLGLIGASTFAVTAYADESSDVMERHKKHQEMMSSGKTTHEEAWSATSTNVSPAEAKQLRAKAKKHQEVMNQGKPHEQAWQATDADQATR